VLILFIAAGIILAFAGALIAGRLGGLGVTVLYGVTLAFFWMPPRFSLRVTNRQDIYALAFYGTAGLVLAETAPSANKKREATRVCGDDNFAGCRRVETKLSLAVAKVMSSDIGERLRSVGLFYSDEAFSLPCAFDEASHLLADVLTAALEVPEVRRVSIYPGRRPGSRQLTVAAHYIFPAPLRSVVTIGKRDSDSEPGTFAGWPSHSGVTTFDNGYSRIFQISILDG
jgi:hypothetical protein